MQREMASDVEQQSPSEEQALGDSSQPEDSGTTFLDVLAVPDLARKLYGLLDEKQRHALRLPCSDARSVVDAQVRAWLQPSLSRLVYMGAAALGTEDSVLDRGDVILMGRLIGQPAAGVSLPFWSLHRLLSTACYLLAVLEPDRHCRTSEE